MSSEFPEKKHVTAFFKHSAIKKRVIECLQKAEYKKLREDSSQLTKEQISSFFLKEGEFFLRSALVNTLDEEALEFWIEKVPEKVLELLRQDDFSLFREFLEVQVALEEEGLYNSKTEEAQIKKFKALLSIDTDVFVNFLNENLEDEEIVSENIVANLEQALRQYEKENSVAGETGAKNL